MRNSKYAGYWTVQVTASETATANANLVWVRPSPTPFEGLGATADSILAGIIKPIQDGGFYVKQIGSGIYISRDQPFTVTTPNEELFTIIQTSVNDVSKLPTTCLNGYKLKVSNSAEEADDYYLKFKGDEGADGNGVWEEHWGYDIEKRVDKNTMPVQLVRIGNGNFSLQTIDWEDRIVGDDVTNKKLKYIDNKINKVIFFRNRLGFLVGEHIVLSRAGDFYNFWNKTATTIVPIDPIDISCSAQTPAVIYDALEVNSGLLLFADNQQFILTTDSDAFGPKTAKVNTLSTYNYNIRTAPKSLGTTVGFLNNGTQFTRFFEMTGVSRDTEPQIIEQSKLVSKLIPKDYEEFAVSKENSLVAIGKNSSNIVWIYRYFNSGDKRIQSAWVKWTLPGNVAYHTIMDDIYYAVIHNGGVSLQAIGIRPNDTFDLENKTVYLDQKIQILPHSPYLLNTLSLHLKPSASSQAVS